jgi:hypothetical protein
MKLVLKDFDVDVKGLHDNMSDEEFFDFCRQNAELRMERDNNHQIYIMAYKFTFLPCTKFYVVEAHQSPSTSNRKYLGMDGFTRFQEKIILVESIQCKERMLS